MIEKGGVLAVTRLSATDTIASSYEGSPHFSLNRGTAKFLIGILTNLHMDGSPLNQSRWYRLLIHTDASLSGNIVGIGYTIRVDGQTHENATFVEGDYTSMEAEFMALKQAAKVVSEFFEPKEHIFFYTDCKGLAEKLEDPKGKWADRVETIQSLLGPEWSMKWIPRERNNKADELAYTGRQRGNSQVA